MKKCCVVGFVPDPSYPGAEAFLANIREFKTHYPLVLCSHHDYGPGIERLKSSPLAFKKAVYPNNEPNPWSLNNVLFLTCARIAMSKNADFMLYLEADGRVLGDYWDKIVFDEFFAAGEGKLIGGTAVVYNGSNRSMAFTRRWRDFLVLNSNSPWPIPAYGGNGAAEKHEPAVFVNGAFGIYNVAFLKSIYDLENTGKMAAETTAFDYFIGRELVRKFGDEAFNYIAHLSSIYSGYGDVATSQAERQELLQNRQCIAVHQIKSNWKPERISNGGVAQRLDASADEESGRQSHYPPSHAGSTPVAPTISMSEKHDPESFNADETGHVATTASAGSNPATPSPKVSKPRWKRNSL